MRSHVLLNLLNELENSAKMQGVQSITLFFFATSLIHSIIPECK